ncbi:FKBP-type peptidyl-prolyl cis-trans isomerase [Crossiella sp. SN42]|uniref:FKBP-type peptidyl-prolyl cis-trans isomerase n=1 Tax=Crossiella sp. SN42 TaxID=2944808 RepID=UPI00207C52E3|nr:FKBP-type peptidyl-prolyl cis-trans isomerase [Crossiella sp. SN42]MCO1578679.1 FKBP-type peptidyl-prolyl cis-trans isomerase [Crossiella sp. SN42]
MAHSLTRRTLVLLAVGLSAALGLGTATAAAGPAHDRPFVAGAFGHEPVLEIPSAVTPSATLDVRTAIPGRGPAAMKGEILFAHYLLKVWRNNKLVEHSYGGTAPFDVPLGVGKLIKGWDQGLLGVRAGSRVVLTVPPDWGYGPRGGIPEAGILKDDTLVFVVDVYGTYQSAASAVGKPGRPYDTRRLPSVERVDGRQPAITIPAAQPPRWPESRTLVEGRGPRVWPGQTAIVQHTTVAWRTGEVVDSSWRKGKPAAFTLRPGKTPDGLIAGLSGVRAGSRVLLVVPPAQGQTDTLVHVVDVLAAH